MRDERELRRQAALAGRSWLLVKATYFLTTYRPGLSGLTTKMISIPTSTMEAAAIWKINLRREKELTIS